MTTSTPSIKALLGHKALMMMRQEHKTPISILEELSVSFHFITHYTLVETSGMDHMRTFKYRAYVDDEWSACATARKKKDAKHAAAQNLLKLFCSFADADGTGSESVTPSALSPVASSNSSVISTAVPSCSSVCNGIGALNASGVAQCQGNYVGMLQEWCVLRGMAPVYVEEERAGHDHMPTFTTSCSVLQHKVLAAAGNKKAAKKMAAEKMFALLAYAPASPITPARSPASPIAHAPISPIAHAQVKVEPPTPSPPAPPTPPATVNQSMLSPKAEVPSSSTETSCEDLCSNIQDALDASPAPGILRLKTFGVNKQDDHIRALREVCAELDVRISILHALEEKRHRCMVQLYFGAQRAFVVCSGAGPAEEAALQDAARNALDYVIMMARCTRLSFS